MFRAVTGGQTGNNLFNLNWAEFGGPGLASRRQRGATDAAPMPQDGGERTKHRGSSRRRFLGHRGSGPPGRRAVGSGWRRRLSAAQGERRATLPPGKLGVQQFSIRDSITRRSIANSQANGLTPTMGYLGGPNFPADPTDLGPLVPLPGGFPEVFEFLAGPGTGASSSSSSPRT